VSLVSGNEMMKIAEEHGYAIASFDCYNMESTQGIIMAAEEVGAPVILQTGTQSLRWMGYEYAAAILITAAKAAKVPVCVHFDHGPEVSEFEEVKRCIDLGYTSVMIDGSLLPYEENIKLVRKVVEYAHARGVAVESLIGQISRKAKIDHTELETLMTDPEAAADFVQQTNIDYLAVSVGSVHGFYQGDTSFDFERLKKIKELTNVPLVLHGGTGIAEEDLKQFMKLGIRKLNIGHGIRKAFLDSVHKELQTNPDEIDPRKPLDAARLNVKEYSKQIMRMLMG
jgi:fructose-bisphosphate aldolase class II